jgi:hypothetical protein
MIIGKNGNLIAVLRRLLAFQELGYVDIPVTVINVNDMDIPSEIKVDLKCGVVEILTL